MNAEVLLKLTYMISKCIWYLEFQYHLWRE